MEGPTPASALIHAAVQDGVYLIARNFQIFDHAPNVLLVVAVVGAATALFAGVVGLAQTHIKGILAYSTISQLGLMFLACGMGAYAVAVFHMLTHAAVKTYLFLTSPSIIHHVHGGTDLQISRPIKPTGYARVVSNGILLITVLLLALPLLSGWWPGQEIMGVELASAAYVLLALVFMGWFTTVYYSRRLVLQSFAHGSEEQLRHLTGRTGFVLKPMFVITGIVLLAFFLGLLPGGAGGGWFQNFLGDYDSTISVMGYQSVTLLPSMLLGLMLLIVVFSWFVGLYFDRFQSEVRHVSVTQTYRRAYITALNAFWLDERFSRYLVNPVVRAGRFLDRIDTEYIDRFIGLPSLATYQRNDIFLDGFLQKVSSLFSFFEIKVFREGINNALLALVNTLSNLSHWIEEKIFNQWVNEGTPAAGWRLGSVLALQEETLDRPRVIIFASVLFFSTFIVWVFG
jgi:NADH-quinone oxidoreductase subunit L